MLKLLVLMFSFVVATAAIGFKLGYPEDASLPMAYTSCRHGSPYTYIRDDVVDNPQLSLVRIHEAKHREQARRFKGCPEWEEWAEHHEAEAEAEAFCAMTVAEAKPPYDYYQIKLRYATWLAISYDNLELTPELALVLMSKWC